MLSEKTAKELGYKGNFNNFYISSVSFAKNTQIWVRAKENMSQETHLKFMKTKKHSFLKYGKTFGFETVRFVKYHEGKFYYYENESDKEYKGYCSIENLYIYDFDLGNKIIMYLTNGIDYTSLYFKDQVFLNEIKTDFVKEIIQLNFKEKYTMMELLGEGTFSKVKIFIIKVYLGIKNSTKEKYAIKIVPKFDSTGFATKNIVLEEKRILRILNFDKVCKMAEFFEDSHNYIIVLEYLSGKDLNNIFKSNKLLTLTECKFILKEALLALNYIHKKNVIHRDLKPHNIVVDFIQKSVKLIDFGLSLRYDSNIDINKFMRCGTMGYIAPEVVTNTEGNRKKYDTISDMYGFGIVAHMLLLGSNPIRGKTYKETVEKNMNGEVVLNEKVIVSKYGVECFEFLKSLLEKDPKNRMSAEDALKSLFLNQETEEITNPETLDESFTFKNICEINYIEDKEFMGGNSRILNESKEYGELGSPLKKSNLLSSRSSTKISGIH